ncbi:hypothetical protein TNCV_2556231 [Trichonephila clavipes]|nr:hypothetical protein TNCV_2556231 [Trichonephila clavipes]
MLSQLRNSTTEKSIYETMPKGEIFTPLPAIVTQCIDPFPLRSSRRSFTHRDVEYPREGAAINDCCCAAIPTTRQWEGEEWNRPNSRPRCGSGTGSGCIQGLRSDDEYSAKERRPLCSVTRKQGPA